MLEIKKPEIEVESLSADGAFGRFVVKPLQRGYGRTLGNSLRRVLLSSLPGAAVTAIRVEDVYHEFSTVQGVIEDMTEIILNIKGLRLKLHSDEPKTIYLSTEEGRSGVVRAADIVVDDEVEIVNPEHKICTLNGEARVFIEMTVGEGQGYHSSDMNKRPSQPIGVIPIDSIFTPVLKVNYSVEDTRVGQVTDNDKLTLEVWTDGTVLADEALTKAATILMDHLNLFVGLPELRTGHPYPLFGKRTESVDALDASIEDLEFSVRTYNCLMRAGIKTIGDLTMKTKDELMRIRNLGDKSLEEVIQKLEEQELSLSPYER